VSRTPSIIPRPARRYLLSRIALFGCLLGATLHGQQERARQDTSLSEKSPFLPKGYGEKEPEPAPQPTVRRSGPISQTLEVRGVMKLGNRLQFSVFNKKENKSYWIDEGETVEQISARDYDPGSRSLTVTMNGRSERLSLMDASESPLPVPAGNPSGSNRPTNLTRDNNGGDNDQRKVVPRRRVILPRR